MKYFLTILILCPLLFKAQISFFRSYGGSGNDFGDAVLLTSDTNYLVVGATESFGNGATDLYVFKVDSLGDFLWSKTYGGPNIDFGTDAIEMDDGSFLLSGYSNSGSMGYDFYLVKISADGQHLWTHTYGGADWDLAHAISKIKHSTAGYIIAGETYSYGQGSIDGYLVRINEQGDTLWTQTYGGTQADYFKDVIEDDSGNIICIGTTSSNTLYDDEDLWIIKTDSLGNLIWNYVLSDTLNEQGISLCLSDDANYLFAGNNEKPTNYGALYGKIDTLGSILFSNEYTGSMDEFSTKIIRHSDSSSYTLIGNTYTFGGGSGFADLLFSQINGMFSISGLSGISGTVLDDFSMDADTTPDHSIILTGTTNGTVNGISSVFLLKIDQNYNSIFTLIEDLDLNYLNIHEKPSLMIFPNPVKDQAYLSGNKINEELYIWNSMGQFIKKIKPNGNTINLDFLQPGIYLISNGKSYLKSTSILKL